MRYGAWLLLVSLAAMSPSVGSPAPVSTAAAEEGEVTAFDGVTLFYTHRGDGPVSLVFIHGWACNSGFWSAQMDALAPDYRVVALDLPGHGRSGADRGEWSLPGLGADVKTVADALGLRRVILVGHSMGGPVALEAARLMPDRVIGVVGVDTLHDADFKWDPALWRQTLQSFEKDFPASCEGFVESMFLPETDPALVDRVRSEMCAIQPKIGVELLRVFPEYDLPEALGQVQAPIRGINAPFLPTNVENNRRYARDFDVVVMEGVGHFLMMEKPNEFNRLLRQAVESLAR
jgi:pimeloyl-ACP methyl ester carboxylesterase